jgi:glucose-1-phosphate adenylyltransferase
LFGERNSIDNNSVHIMRNLVCFVLGGGKGTRLFPLTEHRSKPAVPLAGKYRLIDIPISNCLNSGINRIFLLTQFNSVSLHRHIRQTYQFDHFDGGFAGILAAQQTMEGADWYQGTADAVRKQLRYVEQYGVDYVLILSGDQLYRMDFQEMLRTHQEAGADVTIGGVPMHSQAASSFGIMKLDDTGRVVGFKEKPQTEEELAEVRTDPAWIDAQGIQSNGRNCMASMGIYLFNRDTLVEMLRENDAEDFGREIFPMAINTRKVQVQLFDGYWEDIGTIKAFYDANIALAGVAPPFEFVVEDAPIYSRPRFLPPTRVEDARVSLSMVADGCVIGAGTVIENSVVGLRCHIGENVTIRNSVLMGNDYYERPDQLAENRTKGRPNVGIGAGTVIDGAIIDKNCRIGQNVRIDTDTSQDADHGDVVIRDGVIVVPKGKTLTDGWSL